ncbi:MAG: putative ribose-5-phosphate isomerase B [Microgenomates bacterium OLB23]|nr:MAG: putative ribose-5-phosphate isomerase B [Microgenomates bacterium OLB23]
MIIYIGADHRGFELKNQLRIWLTEQGHKVVDCGNDHYDAEDDFPDFARAVALKIVQSHEKNAESEQNSTTEEAIGLTSTKSGMYEGVAQAPHEQSEIVPKEDRELGILVCGSGIGVCITANRYKGVRCGAAYTPDHARHGRENDHINVLAVAADMLDFEKPKR